MGMFDSLIIKCPKCGKEMEWQSKSGPCGLDRYTPSKLPVAVAQDLQYDIVGCQYCDTKWKFKLLDNPYAKFKLVATKNTTRKFGKKVEVSYWGNHNPKHPVSIKRAKEIHKWFTEVNEEDKVNKEKVKKKIVSEKSFLARYRSKRPTTYRRFLR